MLKARFIIIGHPRSGTTLFVDSLNQHPEIVCYDELFHSARKARQQFCPAGIGFEEGSDATAYVRSHVFNEPGKFCGFKLLYDQAKTTNLRDYLVGLPDLVVFHLLRDNTLACAASATAAQATGKWHTHRHGRPKREPVVTLHEQQLRTKFRAHDAGYREAEYRFRNSRIVRLFYADLLNSFKDTMTATYIALGASSFTPEMRVKKMNTKPLQERVTNWNRLSRAFAGTPYERFFDPDNP